MAPTTAIATNPSRPPPSPMVEPVQRSPVIRSRISDPRPQQRSGSVRPSPPPRRPSTPPRSPSDKRVEDAPKESAPIDMETFQQILELDDDEDDEDEPYGFAWEMATAYFTQAEDTFKDMSEAIQAQDCKKLSSLGHFLKGSSATLGVTKVQNTCESIQHYGDLKDNKTGKDLTTKDAVAKISAALEEAQEQYQEAETWLHKWHLRVLAEGKQPGKV